MKLLLYSNFSYMPLKDLTGMLPQKDSLTCLFCDYADEKAVDYIARTKQHLSSVFDNIVQLTPDYQFDKPIDCIFVNGGNNFELVYKLKQYNQFNKIKALVKQGTLYVGNSAGSVVAGTNFTYSLNYEPLQIDIDTSKYDTGFNFIDKKPLAHASKYHISYKNGLVYSREQYTKYLKYKVHQKDGLRLPDNAVAVVNDGVIKVKKYPWKTLVGIYKQLKKD